MTDDARFAAALATGLVENDSFHLTQAHSIVVDGTIIHRCDFSGPPDLRTMLICNANRVSITACTFWAQKRDEFHPLHELAKEASDA